MKLEIKLRLVYNLISPFEAKKRNKSAFLNKKKRVEKVEKVDTKKEIKL